MVADSSIGMIQTSQALAVAVTEEIVGTVPESKTFVGGERWAKNPGKIKSCQDIEEKDNRNGLGYFFLGVITGQSLHGRTTLQIEGAYPNQGS